MFIGILNVNGLEIEFIVTIEMFIQEIGKDYPDRCLMFSGFDKGIGFIKHRIEQKLICLFESRTDRR
jgi:hypothetical protein